MYESGQFDSSRDGLIYDIMARDPLEDCLIQSLSTKELNCENMTSSLELMETILSLEEIEDCEHKTPDGLVLKELPKHLCFLR